MGETLCILFEDGEPHGNMEPVENVLGARRHIRCHAPDTVLAIGQERDLLVHLQSLLLQHFMQAAPRFPVEALVVRQSLITG